MKIYTKTGDTGQTSLVGGERVPKNDQRIEAYGTIDELNASIGLVISQANHQPAANQKSSQDLSDVIELLTTIQNHLLDIGSELSAITERIVKGIKIPVVAASKVEWLEQEIDRLDTELEPLKQFILPGGTTIASATHGARTISRRAEREVIRLANERVVNPELIRYLNRLSDLLFTVARVANRRAGIADVPWQKDQDLIKPTSKEKDDKILT